ncbi:LOW QUALITY PROTEIN: Hypothetical protein PHPALM_2652 [Phytophthora palmivora]|uniref:Uncharacterized protein n=1 Tax=Phytophthora palmivora TaxID=4796 RepID=A0A2P4YPC5_9STRA|nr:LOW QUALITY PROTEIN: Hypothetical protein PHPALM_2652 [Phytophthora palmivora]
MDLACHIEQDSTSAIVNSESTMECALPPKIPGNYTLGITCAAGTELLGMFPVEYTNPPHIEYSTPDTVPAGGIFIVDVFGANLVHDDLIFCVFGSSIKRVQTTFISSSHVFNPSKLDGRKSFVDRDS